MYGARASNDRAGPPGLMCPRPSLGSDRTSRQGFAAGADLVAVYEEDSLPALCVGESKASAMWAGQHLNKSIALFREIDARDRDYQIRVVLINSLEAHLPDAVRASVPGMFWRDRRLYLP